MSEIRLETQELNQQAETRQIEKQYFDGHGGHKKITESEIEGSVSCWTMLAHDIDFKTEIEKYSPLKVKIQ